MKALALLIGFMLPLCLQAQNGNGAKGGSHSTNLYSDKVLIGYLVISDTSKTNIVLTSWKQVKDASGRYETTLVFTTKDNGPFYNINLLLKFDKPVISCDISHGITEKGTMPDGTPRKSFYELKVAGYNADSIPISIESDFPVVTTVTGTTSAMDQ